MLSPYIGYCGPAYILLSLILWAFAGHAYRVNAKRAADDPKKRDFPRNAVSLAPFTWPIFLFCWVLLFVIKALLYGVFLVLFTIALLAIRKPFLVILLERLASYIGNKLLEANAFLLRMAFGNGDGSRQPT